jgi:hypothetical protein
MMDHKTRQGELDQAAKEKAYQQSEIERLRERTEEEKAALKKQREDALEEF